MDVVKNIWADILQVVIGQTQKHFLMMFVTVQTYSVPYKEKEPSQVTAKEVGGSSKVHNKKTSIS